MRHPKCGHCPLRDELKPCRGQNNPRACVLTDPGSPDFRPGYDEVLRRAPTLLEKVASFAGAVVEHVATGMRKASAEEQARRLAICRECPLNEAGQCTVCGCPERGVELRTSWAEQACPLEPPRWGLVSPTE